MDGRVRLCIVIQVLSTPQFFFCDASNIMMRLHNKYLLMSANNRLLQFKWEPSFYSITISVSIIDGIKRVLESLQFAIRIK